jgi:response regulator RpfG family c-di-GMP phosphodiesterase
VAEKNSEFISIQITNPDHYIPHQALDMLLKGQQAGVRNDALKNVLYPAKVLVEALGGKLNISSEMRKGITYTVIVPKKWQSYLQEVNALQLATDISRKDARAEFRNIEHLLSSLVEQVPQAMKDNLERLRGKVQELGILCNRSLFLADDLNSRLETQQDRLLQQEAEQLATSEAVLTICREIAGSMHMENIFDLDSAKRVTKYALAIAKEFRLSGSDYQALHHAALLKDLSLVLSPPDMVEQIVVPTIEEAMAFREHFNLLWKTLSTIPFLSPALIIVLHRYERYDGTRGSFGVGGNSIPLGARILAIADTFDSITSGQPPHKRLAPRLAVQNIVDDSGMCFDPHVVGAFLMAWKRKELDLASM